MKFVLFGYHDMTDIVCQFLVYHGNSVLRCIPNSRKSRHIDKNLIETLYFEDIRETALETRISEFEPDYIVACICGEKIPQSLIRKARKFAFNMHPAMLPVCRTANAWYWPLRLGYTENAITFHFLTDNWDAGDILFRYPFSLSGYDNQFTHVGKLTRATLPAFTQFYALLVADAVTGIPQTETSDYYPRLKWRDLVVNWDMPAMELYDHIRASNPFHPPITHFMLSDHRFFMEVLEVEPTDMTAAQPGEILIEDGRLFVSCKDVFAEVTVLRYNGILSGRRFVESYNIKTGDCMIYSATVPEIQEKLDITLPTGSQEG